MRVSLDHQWLRATTLLFHWTTAPLLFIRFKQTYKHHSASFHESPAEFFIHERYFLCNRLAIVILQLVKWSLVVLSGFTVLSKQRRKVFTSSEKPRSGLLITWGLGGFTSILIILNVADLVSIRPWFVVGDPGP